MMVQSPERDEINPSRTRHFHADTLRHHVTRSSGHRTDKPANDLPSELIHRSVDKRFVKAKETAMVRNQGKTRGLVTSMCEYMWEHRIELMID
mmetsp:Transcript_17618/g.48914  ORF Transcript_17618/g.48914 Transcript_17618/m.48914 type:complete len:93 (-) Transcript_17618:88-366(-)